MKHKRAEGRDLAAAARAKFASAGEGIGSPSGRRAWRLGKLRGLAFVAALAAAPGVFGVSPAFAQCASGTSQSLINLPCQVSNASGFNSPNNTSVGLGADASGFASSNTAFGANAKANSFTNDGSSNIAIGGANAATDGNLTNRASNIAIGTGATAAGANAGGPRVRQRHRDRHQRHRWYDP